MQEITIRQPDDWHLHLRDQAMLAKVLPFSSQHFARAIIMPNLVPPITHSQLAVSYRQRICHLLNEQEQVNFTPLMTCYLQDSTDAKDLIDGFKQHIFYAAKLYPAHATTNSAHGVSDIKRIYPVLAEMEKAGMPLLVHGEITDPDIDLFDREVYFIERVLQPTIKDFPQLKVVCEHITTAEAVAFVLAAKDHIAATITPQHLLLNRNAIFQGGIRPHYYCLPILKKEKHRQALVKAATSSCRRFFLGTDSAPHGRSKKECACGCAGIFNAPVALSVYATVFEQADALSQLEAFCSLNGAAFYQLPVNQSYITLRRSPFTVPEKIALADGDELIPFMAGETLPWSVVTSE